MLLTQGQVEMCKLPLPTPSMDAWRAHQRRLAELTTDERQWTAGAQGNADSTPRAQFRVHVRTMGVSRWIVCRELPTELSYDEWLYFGDDGLPAIYWNAKLAGLMLL